MTEKQVQDILLNKLSFSQDALYKLDIFCKEVLEYNHQHFYGKFREIIVDELLWNFKKQVNWYNHDRIERYRLPINRINFEQVRNLMLS